LEEVKCVVEERVVGWFVVETWVLNVVPEWEMHAQADLTKTIAAESAVVLEPHPEVVSRIRTERECE
jgi:hypothetical protein